MRLRWIVGSFPALVLLVGCMPKKSSQAVVPVSGGAAMFQAKGCAQCHAIDGTGGHKGPDLTHVGARLSRKKIESQIVNGGDAMPAYKDVLTVPETRILVRYLHKLR